MDQSLSIIIAAHNAQNRLARQVADLLELASELADEFDLLIVDDGSHDGTEEVAYDLTLQYPQVHLLRHKERLGVSAAVRSGMRRTQGDIVFVQEAASPVKVSEVRRLWSMRGDDDVLVVRENPASRPAPIDPSLLKRLTAWGANVARTAEQQRQSGLRMIRRAAAEQAADALFFELERIEGAEPARGPRTRQSLRQPRAVT